MTAGTGKDSRAIRGRRRDKAAAERHDFERSLAGGPGALVCGVDEVGRGPLAGPVVAAAVILKPDAFLGARVTDSKLLTHAGRILALPEIAASALAISWRAVSPSAIDRVNIRQATFLAMRGAVAALAVEPEVVVTDGEACPGMPYRTVGFPKADFLVPAVAAASIVAKVIRDALMEDLARFHPQYGFERHRGYPTPEHLEALRVHGPCPQHRRSFAPVRASLERELFA